MIDKYKDIHGITIPGLRSKMWFDFHIDEGLKRMTISAESYGAHFEMGMNEDRMTEVRDFLLSKYPVTNLNEAQLDRVSRINIKAMDLKEYMINPENKLVLGIKTLEEIMEFCAELIIGVEPE